jgi:carboxypeptidase C (cathepsin A)
VSAFSLATRAIIVLAATAACADPIEPVTTRHELMVQGRMLAYTAEVGRIAIRDGETGEPHGYIFYTAYHATNRGETRPLTFIWNGGPGADSALLHFSMTGPMLARERKLVPNPDTWLSFSDLVLVDPVGTGFSRPAQPQYAAEFYSTRGDVASVTEFVRSWRLLHAATDAPLYLVGESWGARRAASVGYALESRRIPVRGMVLISGGSGLNKEYVPPTLEAALQTVDMASTALFYGKTAPDLGQDPVSVRRAAEAWARRSYAPALARARALSDEERSALVAQLARFTGIAPERIDPQKLVISPRQFRTELLKKEAKELYQFDTRRTTVPASESGRAILHYLRYELNYRTDLPYIGLEPLTQGYAPSGAYPQSVNERWNYATEALSPEQIQAAVAAASAQGGGPPRLGAPLPATEEAIALDSGLKVLVAAGMYDAYLPCAVGAQTEASLPAPLQRAMHFKCYDGGHAMYLDDPARAELTRDVKVFMTESRENQIGG